MAGAKMKYQPLMKARDYQEEASRLMKGREAFALLMAMRTGKTKVALDDFGSLEAEGKASDLIVIAPAGVYRTWLEQVKDHVSLDLQARLLKHVWQAGKAKAAVGFLAASGRPRILLMNVEALSRPGDARKIALEFTRQNRAMIVVDESTVIKNPQAKRTKFINTELAPLSSYRRILSGLCTPRSPLDLFSQFEFLDWNILGFRSYYAFRARYAIMRNEFFGGRRVMIVSGYRDVEELHALIEPYSFRVPFRPNIPPTYSIRDVKLSEEQEKAYKELKEYATTKLSNGSHVTSTIVISQMLRLHQILCGHVKDEQGEEHLINEHRTEELIDLLEEYQGKAVIWCSYDTDIRKVSEALKEHFKVNVARFWGGNMNTREDEEKEFKTRDDTPYMVATPDAGGRGRTWDCADLVIYYSSKNNLEHRDQSEQRVQGVDKKRPVDYVDLIVPNTVEMKFLEALRNKIDMAGVINGDNYREWLI
jgi:SNF2 family DNA or RNA helicase